VGFVTRGPELLVFEHEGVLQVPAGRIDHGERLEEGLVREVAEETGVTGLRIVGELADADEVDRLYGVQAHPTSAFHATLEPGGPDAWEHRVSGSGMDSGFVFACRWVPLDEPVLLWGKPDPLVERLRGTIDGA
jgi:8-oxo-dGTP pyrophosphatase MutT (NUDIX family)